MAKNMARRITYFLALVGFLALYISSYASEVSLNYYKQVNYLEEILANKVKEAIAPLLIDIPYFVVVKVHTKIKEQKEYKEEEFNLPGVYLHDLLARYKHVVGVRKDILVTKLETYITVDESISDQQVSAVRKAVEGVLPFNAARGDVIEIKRVPIIKKLKKGLQHFSGDLVNSVKKDIQHEVQAQIEKELEKLLQGQEDKISILVEKQAKQLKSQLESHQEIVRNKVESLKNKIEEINRRTTGKINELTTGQRQLTNNLLQTQRKVNDIETSLNMDVLPQLTKQEQELRILRKYRAILRLKFKK